MNDRIELLTIFILCLLALVSVICAIAWPLIKPEPFFDERKARDEVDRALAHANASFANRLLLNS